MPTQVEVAARFQKDMKHLKKKYPAVSAEVRDLIGQLEADERPGDKIPGVGYDVYKVRLKNPAAGKGKSGGFRVIYYVRLTDSVILLTIYAKSEQINISPESIQQILENIVPPDDNEDK